MFASELKALLLHPGVRPEIDAGSVAELIMIGPGRTPGCGVFRGLKELEAGCCGFFGENGLKLRRYWALTDREHADGFESTAEKVRRLVEDSIERQLVSDVPVCAFLSGGLDSSIIAAVAAGALGKRGERLKTFSVHYRGNEKYFRASKFQPDSDDAYIDLISGHIGSEHHKIFVDTPALAEALYEAVDARDLPGMADVDASLRLFCGEGKKSATVALSGECADEIFGGYPWYRHESVREAEGFPWAQSAGYRASFLRDELLSELNPEKYVRERYYDTVRASSVLPGLSPLERRMREMVNLNFRWFMQTLLDRKDRMSMHHGLEVRVPFCDYRIAEYLYSPRRGNIRTIRGGKRGCCERPRRDCCQSKYCGAKKAPIPKPITPFISSSSRSACGRPSETRRPRCWA